MAGVSIVDAGGLGAMLELREQAKSKGIRFELMNLNKWVRYVLEVSRLDSVFEVKSEVECLPTVSRNRHAPAPWRHVPSLNGYPSRNLDCSEISNLFR